MEHAGLISTPEFWVAVAFVVFVVGAFKPGRKALLSALDARAEKIRAELNEAAHLREEAQSLLATYQRQQRDALKQAEEILAHAREEAKRQSQQAAEQLKASLKRHEQQALDRIKQAEGDALAEVRNRTVDVAVSAAREALARSLDAKAHEKLIQVAIGELPGKLH